MNRWLRQYEVYVKTKLNTCAGENDDSQQFWQDQLFINFLTYCVPVSLLSVLPGIYICLKENYPNVTAGIILSFSCLIYITLSTELSLKARKIGTIVLTYALSIFLISTIGYVGPGIFYLYGITVLIALVLPISYAYWSVFFNAVLLFAFAIIINNKLFECALIHDYTPGKWLAFSSSLIFLSAVSVMLIQGILAGLQETIQNKNQLQEKYKNIFDYSPLPMWLFDTDTLKFLEVNDAALYSYGYSRDEFLKMTIKDIRSPDKNEGLENLVKTNKLTGKYYRGNAEHVRKDGQNIYVRIESKLLDMDGRSVRLVLATDITREIEHQLEIFNVNQKIKESESNLRAIFESATDGFVLLDTQCSIRTFNPKAAEYIKFNQHQKPFEVGKSIFEYIESSRHKTFYDIITKVLNGQIIEYERKHRNAAKLMIWVRYTIIPVIEDNIVTGVSITGHDITSRRLYLRTVEDQNKTFREISWMQSHMVRAPLARIMGLTNLLRDCETEAERHEILDLLEFSSHELDDVIKVITQKSNDITSRYSVPVIQKTSFN